MAAGSVETADSKQLPWARLSYHSVAKQLAAGKSLSDRLSQAQVGVHCSATAAGLVCRQLPSADQPGVAVPKPDGAQCLQMWQPDRTRCTV